MFKLIKYLFYVLAIVIIGASVYIASLPSEFEHTFNVQFNKAPKSMIKNKVLNFDQWKDWAIKDTSQFKVLKSRDPLQSSLQNSLTNKQEFKLENEQINDSIVVQKMYSKKEKTVQILTWSFGIFRTVDKLTLTLKEELSFGDKLSELLKWKNGKRDWLLNLENRLSFLHQQVIKKSSDYTVGPVKRSSFGPSHYIYMTSSGNINHLADQTQEHIIKLEQFLANKGLKSIGKPFTIYNNNLTNGDIIFSTALPIKESLEISAGNSVRYGFIEISDVFTIQVIGNPKNIEMLWQNFKQTKELTLSTMSTNKYILHNTIINDDVVNQIQELVWGIQPEVSESALDSIPNVTRVPKDPLFESL